jgi:hypothetical protein
MAENTLAQDRFDWRLLVLITIGALIVLVPITIYDDFAQFVFIIVITPIVSFVLLVIAILSAIHRKRWRGLSLISDLIPYCLISWVFLRSSAEVRAKGRWLLGSNKYKAEMLTQVAPENGELQHLEWDGFGFAGSETVVYLVLDPSGSLAQATKSRSAGKFDGIPCEVSLVQRLERNWYSVRFYTNSGWGVCS